MSIEASDPSDDQTGPLVNLRASAGLASSFDWKPAASGRVGGRDRPRGESRATRAGSMIATARQGRIRTAGSILLALLCVACPLWPPIDPDSMAADPVDKPWVRELPEGKRTLYVGPGGTGDGTSLVAPMSLEAATAQASPGDRFWLSAGDYRGAFRLAVSGTDADPIVYRAMRGARVRVIGCITITGEHNWVWGLEVTDPGREFEGDSIHAAATGTVLVNNVLHDEGFDTSLGSWNRPGQIVYGNVIYHGHHNIYTQNSGDAGYRYFVHNVSMDAKPDADGRNGPFEFHAYAEGGDVSGFYLRGNVFSSSTLDGITGHGRVLVGGRNPTANERIAFLGNFFYNARLQLGYRRPVQAVVRNNYLVDSHFEYGYFWGGGERRFPGRAPIVVSGNEFHMRDPEAKHAFVRTSAYLGEERSDGLPRLAAMDEWDANTYSPRFFGVMTAGDEQERWVRGLGAWRSASAERGNRFDATSREAPFPTEPRVVLIPNDYEEGRGLLVVYNHGEAASVSVDLSPVLTIGGGCYLYRAKGAFSDPVVADIYRGGSVSVPVAGRFEVFIVSDVPCAP